jgi:hypothetical protein
MNMSSSVVEELQRRMADGSLGTDMNGGVSIPVLNEATLERAENQLGFKLPPDAGRRVSQHSERRIRTRIRLLPFVQHDNSSAAETAVGLYTAFCEGDSDDPAWVWPRRLLPFCDWGCAIRSCVDCSSPNARVVSFDPNVHQPGEDMSAALAVTHESLGALVWGLACGQENLGCHVRARRRSCQRDNHSLYPETLFGEAHEAQAICQTGVSDVCRSNASSTAGNFGEAICRVPAVLVRVRVR